MIKYSPESEYITNEELNALCIEEIALINLHSAKRLMEVLEKWGERIDEEVNKGQERAKEEKEGV